jgi:integrase
VRRRKLQSGAVVKHTRYVLNYRDPTSGRQEFFERAKDAQSRRSELLGQVASGSYVDERTVPTIADAVEHWLADRTGKVKASTLGRPQGRGAAHSRPDPLRQSRAAGGLCRQP